MFKKSSIVKYNSKWPKLFEAEAADLLKILQDQVIWIEHIGSTTLPNMPSRPIIDILIGVRDLQHIDSQREQLYKAGYELKSDLSNPWGQFLVKGGGKRGPCCLCLFQMGYAELARPINLKHYLLTHPFAFQKYRLIKTQNASNLEKYNAEKSVFLRRIEPRIKIYVARQTITTERLCLRPFTLQDASRVAEIMMADKGISDTAISIPYPYDFNIAKAWIQGHRKRAQKWQEVVFAITLKDSQTLIGAMGLGIKAQHQHGELGYWLDKEYRNQGYCTEATRHIVTLGFTQLGLNRISAISFSSNQSSNKVLQKIGLQHEGHFRHYFKKDGQFRDIEQYAVLSTDSWHHGVTDR